VDDDLLSGYLHRLGVEHEPPSFEALCRIHRAHVERIPYETLWIHMAEGWGLDPIASAKRIVEQRRGGYCFHLNGALFEVLRALGYDVTRHVGSVSGPAGPQPDEVGNHLALIVHNLAAAHTSTTSWHVDVGLGDALYEPLPLVLDSSVLESSMQDFLTQGHSQFAMSRIDEGHWQFSHDVKTGSFTSMTFATETAAAGAFDDQHRFLATSPNSHFVRTLTAQRRDSTGVDALRGLILKRVGPTITSTELASPDEWFAALADVFGLTLEQVPAQAKNRLWQTTYDKHQAWRNAPQ
jgi:N-hydroxyarylamine O-acetyltransferase